MLKEDELKEISITYQQAFESYTSLKSLSNFEFGGDVPGRTKYRLCTIISKQIRDHAEEFEAFRDDLLKKHGEEDFERDKEGNYKIDPETNKKLTIGKVVKLNSIGYSDFLKELKEFGKKEIPNKIKIPKDGMILTTIGDPGDVLESLDWILSDVIFEKKEKPEADVLKTLETIKDIMAKVEKKL